MPVPFKVSFSYDGLKKTLGTDKINGDMQQNFLETVNITAKSPLGCTCNDGV